MAEVVVERVEQVEARRRGGKYLSFFLEGEEYGIEILRVREILGILPITSVPRAPECIRGVVNLRGKVIPILDLRLKFGMPRVDTTDETCIIVVQSGQDTIGTVVDRVSEVHDIPEEDIVDTPSFGTDVNTDYILGLGKAEGRVKILLDMDRVLAGTDTIPMADALEAAEAAA